MTHPTGWMTADHSLLAQSRSGYNKATGAHEKQISLDSNLPAISHLALSLTPRTGAAQGLKKSTARCRPPSLSCHVTVLPRFRKSSNQNMSTEDESECVVDQDVSTLLSRTNAVAHHHQHKTLNSRSGYFRKKILNF